jgi:hypothetical protein
MPPWPRTRSGDPNDREKASRRHSVFDIESFGPQVSVSDARNIKRPFSQGSALRRVRDSVLSLSAVDDAPIRAEERPLDREGPEPEPRSARPHRFSLLRRRYASDSQLSRTADEHSRGIASRTGKVPRARRLADILTRSRYRSPGDCHHRPSVGKRRASEEKATSRATPESKDSFPHRHVPGQVPAEGIPKGKVSCWR